MKKLFIFLALIIIPFGGLADEAKIKVLYSTDTDKIEYIDALTEGGIIYVPAKIFADIFYGKTFFNPKVKKLVIYFKKNEIKLSALSSFVVINGEMVINLPLPLRFYRGEIYVPLKSFVNLLSNYLPGNLQFKEADRAIEVNLRLFNITGIEIVEKANGTLIKISTTKEFGPNEYKSWINRAGWLYVTISGGILDSLGIVSTRPAGVVSRIVPFQMPQSAQISFRLKRKVESSEIYQTTDPNQIIISLRTPISGDLNKIQRDLQSESKKWLIDRIVIDAGHGGKDPGSIGPTGLQEKEVTLDVAKRLGRMLKKQLKVEVVYTREEDVFVPLWKRTKIANQTGGKLFISIHSNANRNKNINGFEIYLLRPGRTADAIEVAERENSVIRFEESTDRYADYSNENFILASLAQSAFMKESEDLANIMQLEMRDRLRAENRGVKQAGFYVLVGSSMPNILVELGYMSNKYEEKKLKSRRYRQRLAVAIFESIKRFKKKYEKTIVATYPQTG
ncbi:MAG: N-acetylmuramoyl-L-alanine amidase [Fidelibacterota bacterium]